MKKIAFLLCYMSLFAVLTASAKDEEENTYRYELENLTDRTMANGQVMVKVWNYGKKEKMKRNKKKTYLKKQCLKISQVCGSKYTPRFMNPKGSQIGRI